jgi:hypothetical protein
MSFQARIVGHSLAIGLSIVVAFPAAGHQTTGRHNKTQNGAGCQVPHSHFGQCISGSCANGAPCPTDATCESSFGFSSADRKFSWTNAWNCHGRTFDNRGSWTGSADLFVSCEPTGVCPVSPQAGDAILWGGGTVHSVTIVGAWNNLSTRVRSKYGCCGEYEHALSNSTNVYGAGWSVARYSSSPVFTAPNGGLSGIEGVPFNGDPEQLARISQTMPWYETVIASAVEYAVEHPRRVREAGRLSPKARKLLLSAEDVDAKLAILAEDLKDERHYQPLAAYNHVSHGLDFIEGIEAGQVLIKLAQDHPAEVRPTVTRLLEETALGKEHAGAARGASVFFLSKILTPEEKADLKQRLSQPTAEKVAPAPGQESILDFFSRSYLGGVEE